MRSVLMVAYHYPPEGSSSGVLRTLKFSKYLPAYDWLPNVLTLRDSLYRVRDERLLQDLPKEVVVHRTFALDASRHLAIRGRHLGLFAVPDRLVSWLPFGMARGLRVIRRARVDAIYSTSPLPTAHLIAAVLRAATGIPWVADFRDPWIEDGLYPSPGTLRQHVETALEALVVRRADRLTVTTSQLREEFLRRYPGVPGDKIRVIYNGYDEEDFQGLGHVSPGHTFEIVHAGMVNPEYRDPFPFLRALGGLIAEGAIPREGARVTFLGGGKWLLASDFSEGVRRLGLAGVVQVDGRVPHREALRRQAQAAGLLVLQASDDTRSLIPAKAFEYLRLGRPILSVTLDGATADLLRGEEQCYVVDPADAAAMRRAVVGIYRGWREASGRVPCRETIHRYERRRLTGELAAVLDELVSRHQAPSRRC